MSGTFAVGTVTNADGSTTTTHPDGSTTTTVATDGTTSSTAATLTVAEEPELAWYCPACGLRFASPGTDDTGHPPTELLPLGAATVVASPGAVEQVGPLAEETPVAPSALTTQASDQTVTAEWKAATTSALQTALGHLQTALDAIAGL